MAFSTPGYNQIMAGKSKIPSQTSRDLSVSHSKLYFSMYYSELIGDQPSTSAISYPSSLPWYPQYLSIFLGEIPIYMTQKYTVIYCVSRKHQGKKHGITIDRSFLKKAFNDATSTSYHKSSKSYFDSFNVLVQGKLWTGKPHKSCENRWFQVQMFLINPIYNSIFQVFPGSYHRLIGWSLSSFFFR